MQSKKEQNKTNSNLPLTNHMMKIQGVPTGLINKLYVVRSTLQCSAAVIRLHTQPVISLLVYK